MSDSKLAYNRWYYSQPDQVKKRAERKRALIHDPPPPVDWGNHLFRCCFMIYLIRMAKERETYYAWKNRVKEQEPEKWKAMQEKLNASGRERYREKMEDKKNGKKNREKHRARVLGYFTRRAAVDPAWKLQVRLRTRVCRIARLQRLNVKPMDVIGCSAEELRAHLESQFLPGMSWANYGRGKQSWCIDHIRPCASFNLSEEAQAKAAFHYTNLRPLWRSDNASKSSHWNGKHWTHNDHK